MKTIAVVTGASAGMGREFALQIDRLWKPDEIWLVARRGDRLRELAASLSHAQGIVIEADLAQPAGCNQLETKLAAEKPQICVFVNNAGFGTYGPFMETDREWQLSMIDVNVRALTALSWIAVPYMSTGSKLINVASLASFQPLGNFAVYAATKAYVLSFSMALTAELESRGIVVTALCPGSVDTEFAAVASSGARTKVTHGHPADRVVATCLRHARAGRCQSIYAADWKFTAFLSRFVGRRLTARLTWRFNKRPQAWKAGT